MNKRDSKALVKMLRVCGGGFTWAGDSHMFTNPKAGKTTLESLAKAGMVEATVSEYGTEYTLTEEGRYEARLLSPVELRTDWLLRGV